MGSRAKVVRNLAFTAGIALALGFGAKQTAAYSVCKECTQPPPTECEHYPDPNLFCENLCVNLYDCENGGECFIGATSECMCLEK